VGVLAHFPQIETCWIRGCTVSGRYRSRERLPYCWRGQYSLG
jgi:hypothetical protein